MRSLTAILVSVVLMVVAAPALADHNSIHLVHKIVPGKAMGTAELGMSQKKIRASGTLCAVSGARFDSAGKAVWLETNTGGSCETSPGGIQVGHDVGKVLGVFGKPDHKVVADRYPHATAFWYRYNRLGIEFYILEWVTDGVLNTQITEIAVFPPKKK